MCGVPAVMAASAAISAISALYTGYTTQQQMQYQADVAKNNAKAAQYQMGGVEIAGEAERENIRLNAAQLEAQGMTGYAANGVALGSGSPLSWSMDTAERAAMDVETSRYNTELQLWALENNQMNYLAQSGLYESGATNALTTGVLNAASSVANVYASGASAAYWSKTPS